MIKLIPTPIGQAMIAKCNPSYYPVPKVESPIITSKVKEKRVEHIRQRGDQIDTIREVYVYDTSEEMVDTKSIYDELMRRLDQSHTKPSPYVRNSAGYIEVKMSEMERMRRNYDRLFKDQNQKLKVAESVVADLKKTVDRLNTKHKKLSKKHKTSKSRTVIVENTPPPVPKMPDNVIELKLNETREAVASAVPYIRALATMAMANQSRQLKR